MNFSTEHLSINELRNAHNNTDTNTYTDTYIMRIFSTLFLLIFLGSLGSLSFSQRATAQPEAVITKLSGLDRGFITAQRELLDDIARRNLGVSFSGEKDRDLKMLQTLLDKQLVQQEQKRELQAMGVILGEHLAAELNMHWVIFEDKLGRSRALRYQQSDNYLFPMTMISRRREVGNTESVAAIYQKAYATINSAREERPFTSDSLSH